MPCVNVRGPLSDEVRPRCVRINPWGSAAKGYSDTARDNELFPAEERAETFLLPWGHSLRGWGVNDIG